MSTLQGGPPWNPTDCACSKKLGGFLLLVKDEERISWCALDVSPMQQLSYHDFVFGAFRAPTSDPSCLLTADRVGTVWLRAAATSNLSRHASAWPSELRAGRLHWPRWPIVHDPFSRLVMHLCARI
eukprot:360328-Chlamydomonas_euryale.AAC.5